MISRICLTKGICHILVTLSFLMCSSFVMAENKSSSVGEVFKEIPTLHCLGVRWKIMGDQNKNAVIKVHYRKGKEKWLEAMPLFRTMPSPHGSNRSKLHTVPGGWMFAGSIFNLTPDTEYEVKLNLEDPDGGKAEKTMKMKTWTEPLEPKGMKKIYVVPGAGGGEGTKGAPFLGIVAAMASAKPGTLLILKAGKYSAFGSRASGQEGKPIIIRGSAKGETIIDGGGKSCVDIYNKKHIWFESLDFRNAKYGINGNLASNIIIRRCTFRKVVCGFNSEKGGYNRSRRHFIVDNEYTGSTKWPRSKGIEAICFVQATGGGHVIAYNRIQNAGDGVHGKFYQKTEGWNIFLLKLI
ncbi:MAG: hypothetical protein COA79_09160 [Planctomycetota bacterium]|nr:MAG: hypothetical protein COA79_09160 [Planctomycetota bacterium]